MSESISPTVEFISLAKEFRHEYVVEKSRFITTVYPCKTEEEAQTFISRINKEFWDARHNCTAYGKNNNDLPIMENHQVQQVNQC